MEIPYIHKPKIVVIGSCNTDMVVKANRLPVPGETILGGSFYMNPGGKGANQAIAAARLGADVTFISKIGYDLFGLQALEIYKSERINTEFIFTDSKSRQEWPHFCRFLWGKLYYRSFRCQSIPVS